jgi:prephenate dehydratase
MTNIKIAYFGHPGSFSYLAALKFLKKRGLENYFLFPCQSFDEVMDYVLVGESYGVVPYYNNSAGHVSGHQSLNEKYKNLVIDDINLAVHHNLLSLRTVKPAELNQVVSHHQALLQCQNYLKSHFPSLKQISYSTTSTAAYDLVNGVLPSFSAVIASAEAAKKYGLKTIAPNIEDNPDNRTHFKVLRK